MGKRKESGYRAGSQVLRIPSAHGNCSLFHLSIFITLLLFLCWGRERNSLFAQGRFHGSLLLRLPMPVLFMLGRAGRRIPSAHGNRSLFHLSIFITLLLFLCWERERNSQDTPPSSIAPYRECTITVEYKKSRIVCVEGIRQALLSATLCFLPRVYKYHRMQEEPHSLRRRNSSDLSLRHALLPAESLQLL